MDTNTKQILIYLGMIVLGVVIVFSGLNDIIHDFAIKGASPILNRYSEDKADTVFTSVGYTAQILIATVLLISPFSAAGGIWFFNIFYELVIGINKDVNVFLISPFLNKVIGILALIMFFYSFYMQKKWVKKLTEPLPYKTDDKDLTRLI